MTESKLLSNKMHRLICALDTESNPALSCLIKEWRVEVIEMEHALAVEAPKAEPLVVNKAAFLGCISSDLDGVDDDDEVEESLNNRRPLRLKSFATRGSLAPKIEDLVNSYNLEFSLSDREYMNPSDQAYNYISDCLNQLWDRCNSMIDKINKTDSCLVDAVAKMNGVDGKAEVLHAINTLRGKYKK